MKIRILALLCFALWSLALSAQADTAQADTLKDRIPRAAVVVKKDTLFLVRASMPNVSAEERALLINKRLDALASNANFHPDSLRIDTLEGIRILYGKQIILAVAESDAVDAGVPAYDLARQQRNKMEEVVSAYRHDVDLWHVLGQVGLALLTIIIAGFVIRYINRLFKFFALRLHRLQVYFEDGIKIKDYQLLGSDQILTLLNLVVKIARILTLIIIFYITLPIILKIFPWTEGIANMLFGFILDPAKAMFLSFVAFIPNLFSIIVIYVIFHYIAKGVHYIAEEIRTEKLKISGFYPDWAIPTSRIVKFLLYAFMVVLIWPYIPGSDSSIFKGVSVFLGVLVSLGSGSAISNVMSGLVITYMRPFKIGDRVRIGEVSGDVVEKNLLVTRVKTIKNEVITVPNSSILNNSSINYSQSSETSEGLIVHSTVTIGYDVPWRLVHNMLIESACKTPMVEQNPKPFVLQTSLDDFYISYQVNAYTKQPAKQSMIYSDLHALIQDTFARNGVEIMSPHYRAEREGPSTIPPQSETNNNATE